ncbi:MAG: hypothetical protein JWL76_1820 [Thermoleophilia bacterium]|nr:hypothetical protein [Thermoleophilia bacterium]
MTPTSIARRFEASNHSPPQPSAATGHIDKAIAELALPQHGAIRYDQLIALGLSKHGIASRARRGVLHRRHPQVYFVAYRRSDFLAETSAALLAMTGVAAVCGRCAAAHYGIYDRGGSIVEVVSTMRQRLLDNVTIRWTRSLPDDELSIWRDLQITTPARTIIDLAEYCTEHQVAFAIHEARRLRLMRLAELTRLQMRHRSRHGAAILRRAIELHLAGSVGTRSGGEDELLARFRAAGIPVPRINMRVATGRGHVECDFYWPELKLNIELDGREHRLPARSRKDEARDRKLARVGIEVVRFTPAFMDAAVDTVAARFAALRA